MSSLARGFYFQGGGILIAFDLATAGLAIWLVAIAWKATTAITFAKFHQSQRLLAITGIAFGLYTLTYLTSDLQMLFDENDNDLDRFQWAGTIITGMVPLLASIVSLTFSAHVRRKFIDEVKEN